MSNLSPNLPSPNQPSPNQPSPSDQPAARPWRTVAQAAAISFVVVLAAGATIVGTGLFADDPVPARATLDANASASASLAPVATTRLAVQGPRRLLDPQAGGSLGAGREARVLLPELPTGTSAVLLQVSIRDAKGPGAVAFRSSTEQTPVLRVAAAGGQTSATVVAGIGPDRALNITTEGGGRLQVDLVGAFEPAASSTSGRIVTTEVTRLVQLTPAKDGNDVTVDLTKYPALREDGAVSALLVQVSGDVGKRGGYVSFGPSADKLDQTVYWAATAGEDRIRPGFLLVPVRSRQLHVQYHAGTQMRADLVGLVTGPAAAEATAGLVVPVPTDAATPVKLTAGGAVDVALLPATGAAGVTPDLVSAALVTVNATGAVPGGVSLDGPGADGTRVPDVSAGKTGRTALALSPVVDGAVNVASQARSLVVLTPRALVLE